MTGFKSNAGSAIVSSLLRKGRRLPALNTAGKKAEAWRESEPSIAANLLGEVINHNIQDPAYGLRRTPEELIPTAKGSDVFGPQKHLADPAYRNG
jgi:hypothetical protein